MTRLVRSPDDPHWRLMLTIAEALLINGVCVVKLDSGAAQARVDLQWSILEVARVFRLATRVQTAVASDPDDRTVTVTIWREDSDGEAITNGPARLEALLRAVEGEHQVPIIPLQASGTSHGRSDRGV
jgi:hypothetical protein